MSIILDRCTRFVHRCLASHCVLCGSASGTNLCAPCAASLPLLDPRCCAVCATPLESGTTCGACLDRTPHFDRVIAAHPYAFPIDALVRDYKYAGNLSLAPLLAARIACAACPDVDAIIPMPLAASRLCERGFNQAHELARHVARALELPVLATACRKVTDTQPQAALPWNERARNVRGAFVCDADLTGKRVAVVDDVMTTGATLNELSRNLKRAGAAWVCGWVLARTLKD